MDEIEQEHEAPAEALEAVEPEQPEPQVDGPEWTDDDEAEARMFGWKPPEEWKGDLPPTYIDDPRQFIERIQKSRPFQAAQKQAEERIARIEREASENARKLAAMNERALEQQRRAYEARLASLSQQQRSAVEMGDVEQFDRLEQERQRMAQYAPQMAEQPQGNQAPPEVVEYAQTEAGAWINDPVTRTLGFEVIEKTPGAKNMGPMEQIRLAEVRLRRDYPELFQSAQSDPEPRRPAASRVDGGGLGAAKQGGLWAKVPADARQQFERFAKEGLFENTREGRERYAREYLNA